MKNNHPGAKRAMSDDVRLKLGVGLWGVVKNALTAGLADRGIDLPVDEVRLVTRFTLEHLEAKGQRIVPVKATLDMHEAMRVALDEGKRMSLKWVQGKTKQRWRYQAALDAAPDWRLGYQQETERALNPTKPEPGSPTGA
jgi:hypothetical protein